MVIFLVMLNYQGVPRIGRCLDENTGEFSVRPPEKLPLQATSFDRFFKKESFWVGQPRAMMNHEYPSVMLFKYHKLA